MKAYAIEAVSVNSSYLLDGEYWVEVSFANGYEGYKALPKALEYDGRQYGQTGWNSDRDVAYYCTSKKFAIPA